jgi:hypothetical protein
VYCIALQGRVGIIQLLEEIVWHAAWYLGVPKALVRVPSPTYVALLVPIQLLLMSHPRYRMGSNQTVDSCGDMPAERYGWLFVAASPNTRNEGNGTAKIHLCVTGDSSEVAAV